MYMRAVGQQSVGQEKCHDTCMPCQATDLPVRVAVARCGWLKVVVIEVVFFFLIYFLFACWRCSGKLAVGRENEEPELSSRSFPARVGVSVMSCSVGLCTDLIHACSEVGRNEARPLTYARHCYGEPTYGGTSGTYSILCVPHADRVTYCRGTVQHASATASRRKPN